MRRNRDPVLVTTAGQDRISKQLFSVPAGGEMKVRVGITVPLGRSLGAVAAALVGHNRGSHRADWRLSL